MQTADVDIVCANYNNGRFLAQFFDSVMASTIPPRALIFVDDGSRDNSVEVARRYVARLPQLRLIELGQNVGFGAALNVGLQAATSTYVLRIDPDDVLHANRIERQLAVLEEGGVDVVGSNATIFQSDSGRVMGCTNFPIGRDQIERRYRSGEHGLLHGTTMIRREWLQRHQYVQANVPAEDYDIFARMLADGAVFANLPDELLSYRVHFASASNDLPLRTVEKTFALRDRIFGSKTSRAKVMVYFCHMWLYRRHLFAASAWRRFGYGVLSAMFQPSKVWRRVCRARVGTRMSGVAP